MKGFNKFSKMQRRRKSILAQRKIDAENLRYLWISLKALQIENGSVEI